MSKIKRITKAIVSILSKIKYIKCSCCESECMAKDSESDSNSPIVV
jgi:hypothetical protein